MLLFGRELGAFGLHLRDATIEEPLLHLELGDAVAQQPADAIGPFEHDDVMAGTGQLLCGGEAGRARADHRDLLTGLHRRRHRLHPAFGPGAVDDLDLDLLDRHRDPD